jgi:hypothetical protein
MTRSRLLLVCSVAMFAFLACSQLAVAQSTKSRFQVKLVPKTQSKVHSDVVTNPPPADNLYALTAAFTASAANLLANTDGSPLWPCFGDTSRPNVDCSMIGDPSVTFPTGGVALGAPQYVWSLADCDGSTNGSGVDGASPYIPCGETETFYEDDSNDTTDDLLLTFEVEQGTKIIADSGTVDMGPNPFGGLTPPAEVVIYGKSNFGTLQTPAGPNNGNCDADINYPTAADPAGVEFSIAAKKTCVDPAPGLATITVTTELATPKYTYKATAAECAPASNPCYTVTYTKKHSISQKWNIFLQ